jgi:hypothetical protein
MLLRLHNADIGKHDIDLWYVYLTERIFEGLPAGEFQQFPYDSIAVVPLNYDFNKIKSPFNKAMLLKQLDWLTDENVRKVITDTASLFDTPFNEIDESAAWSAAWSAARSAESAWSAARSAAWSAESAWSAAESAWSAAWSAESAAQNFYVWMRDTLFELIRQNP